MILVNFLWMIIFNDFVVKMRKTKIQSKNERKNNIK